MLRIGSKVIYQGKETVIIGRMKHDKDRFIIEHQNGWALSDYNVGRNEIYGKNIHIANSKHDVIHRGWHVHKKELELLK